jgi:hypothetical protein
MPVTKGTKLASKLLCNECIKGKNRYDCLQRVSVCVCPDRSEHCGCYSGTGRYKCECCRICKFIYTKRLNRSRVLALKKTSKLQYSRVLRTGVYAPDTCSKCLQSVLHVYKSFDDGERSPGNQRIEEDNLLTHWSLANRSIEQIHFLVKKYQTAAHAKNNTSEFIRKVRQEKVLSSKRMLTAVEVNKLWRAYIQRSFTKNLDSSESS